MLCTRWNRLFIREVEISRVLASDLGTWNRSCTIMAPVMVSEACPTWETRFSMEVTVWADRACSERMLSSMTMP